MLIVQVELVERFFAFRNDRVSRLLHILKLFNRYQFHDGNLLTLLLTATINGIFGLILVFICCELGQRTTDMFDEMNSTIDQLDWYLFPIELERMLRMIIANAQRPVSLQCWGGIACTRDCFKNVGSERLLQ